MQIKGKTVIVTGAARGIGQGIAKAYAQEGANVVVADLGSLAAQPGADWQYALSAINDLQRAAVEIGEGGGSCMAIEVDVSDRASCQNLIDRSVEAFGGLDILVNNAGLIQTGPIVDFAESDWDRLFDVNVKGIFLMSQAAIPSLMVDGGLIVNIASVAGKRGYSYMGAYCASKFATIGLTQSLAAELAGAAIRVNAICPGIVPTTMIDYQFQSAFRRAESEESVADMYHAYLEEAVPLSRETEPQDIADAAIYLTRADSVTGIALAVDAGVAIGVT